MRPVHVALDGYEHPTDMVPESPSMRCWREFEQHLPEKAAAERQEMSDIAHESPRDPVTCRFLPELWRQMTTKKHKKSEDEGKGGRRYRS